MIDSWRNNRGVTLVELMILSAIIAILAMMGMQHLLGINSDAKRIAVHQDLRIIESALKIYQRDFNQLPSEEEGLAALLIPSYEKGEGNGPYLPEKHLTDPWERPYYYRNLDGIFYIYTFGEDGKMGGSQLSEDRHIAIIPNDFVGPLKQSIGEL